MVVVVASASVSLCSCCVFVYMSMVNHMGAFNFCVPSPPIAVRLSALCLLLSYIHTGKADNMRCMADTYTQTHIVRTT